MDTSSKVAGEPAPDKTRYRCVGCRCTHYLEYRQDFVPCINPDCDEVAKPIPPEEDEDYQSEADQKLDFETDGVVLAMGAIYKLVYSQLKLRAEGAWRYISTGIPSVDALMGGGFPPGVHLISAVPGLLKTSHMLWICVNDALQGYPWLIASYELSITDLVARVIGQRTGLAWSDIAAGKYLEESRAALQQLGPANLYFTRGNQVTTDDLDRYMGVIKDITGRTPALAVDYVQIVPSGEFSTATDPRQRTMEVSRGLTGIAQDHSTHVLAISSTARANYKSNPSPEDVLAACKEAGELEYGAATLSVLIRDKGLDSDTGNWVVPKNRFGAGPGVVPIQIDGFGGRILEASEVDVLDADPQMEAKRQVLETVRANQPVKSKSVLVTQLLKGNRQKNYDLVNELLWEEALAADEVNPVKNSALGIQLGPLAGAYLDDTSAEDAAMGEDADAGDADDDEDIKTSGVLDLGALDDTDEPVPGDA